MSAPANWLTLLERIRRCDGPEEVFAVVEPFLSDPLDVDPSTLEFPLMPNVGYALALLTEENRSALDVVSGDRLLSEAVRVLEMPAGGSGRRTSWSAAIAYITGSR